MRNTILSLGLVAALATPAVAFAANTIDASLILSAGRATVDFGKVSAGDSLKLSTSKGTVLVFLDQGK